MTLFMMLKINVKKFLIKFLSLKFHFQHLQSRVFTFSVFFLYIHNYYRTQILPFS